MDLPRARAETILRDTQFARSDVLYEAIYIESSKTDATDYKFEALTLEESDVRFFVGRPTSGADRMSTKLVCVRDSGRAFTCLKDLFHHIWRSFCLEPYLMQTYRSDVPGFIQLPRTSPEDNLMHFDLSLDTLRLMWTFNSRTLSTNGILLYVDCSGRGDGWSRLQTEMSLYSRLAGHPYFLAVAMVQTQLAYMDEVLRKQHAGMEEIERYTGRSNFYSVTQWIDIDETEQELVELAKRSKDASATVAGLADVLHLSQSVTSVFEAVLRKPNDLTGIIQRAMTLQGKDVDLRLIARILEPHLGGRLRDVEYLKNYAETQLSVIFNLLARSDARTALEIARATRDDSTSMKTIALMTMVFLPATFYAALFAVPSLPSTAGKKFWIYWACTIPTTIAVFLGWFAIMNRNKLVRKLLGSRKGFRQRVSRPNSADKLESEI